MKSNSRIVQVLKGNSGCDIFLVKDTTLFVRKISKSLPYNSRLERQCKKQEHFFSNILRAPKVLESGYVDGLFYFDMEYIMGIKLSDFIYKNPMDQVYPKINLLLNFIKSNNTLHTENVQPKIEAKLKQVQDAIECNISIGDYDISELSISYCHGDLTFENIIVSSDGSLYLIDFLDSYIDSRLIDYSKILQDLYFLWSWRHNNNPPLTKIILLRDFVRRAIAEEFVQSHKLMQINLLRILPYVEKSSILYNNIMTFTHK